MNAFTSALLVLIAASCLWIAAMAKVEPAKPIPTRLIPQRAVLDVDCQEKQRICSARKRMEKVQPKGVAL